MLTKLDKMVSTESRDSVKKFCVDLKKNVQEYFR